VSSPDDHPAREVLVSLEDITTPSSALAKMERAVGLQRIMTSLLRISLDPISLEEILQHAIDLACTLPLAGTASKGCVFLKEEDADRLVMKAHRGLRDMIPLCGSVPVGKCLCGRAADYGTIVFAERVDERHEIAHPQQGEHGHYCVPIKAGGRLYGVLNLYLPEGHRRDADDEELLSSYASLLAAIIRRKQVEDAAWADQERLSLAMRATGVGIWDWDLRTNKVFFSPGWKEMLGSEKAEVGNSLHEWETRLHADDREATMRALWDYLEGRTARFDAQYRLRHNDGSYRSFLCRGALLHDENGKPRRMIGTDLDVSELKNMKQALRRKEAQMLAAQEIQQRLLPQAPPDVQGLDICGFTQPAEFAAGDHFDYLNTPDGCLRVVVSDVCGHGIGPALLMASTAAHIRSFLQTRSTISDAMVHTNSLLTKETAAGIFVTLIMVQISPDARTLEYVSAGHPPGYVLSSGGEVKASLMSTGIPLAIDEEAAFATGHPVALDPGDVILLFSDGVIEAASSAGAMFGTERTLRVVREHLHKTAEEIAQALFSAVWAFSGREKQQDDVTAVVVKVDSIAESRKGPCSSIRSSISAFRERKSAR
jgi:sigma-B regulation protein RsbU (phosphoserine phosphatase)